MSKRVKSVSMLLALFGATALFSAHAGTLPGTDSVREVQQQGTCTGVVKDSSGETIIGASVIVKGTPNGTITGLDGDFMLTNVKNGDIIEVSFVGYITQDFVYDGRPLNVTLKEDTQTLDEVVVVGYGTQKKANLTGAVAQVNGEVLESRPISNIGQGLQGVIPNLNVDLNSGAPGQSATYNIRGTESLSGGSPLILVDGVQMDANLINPDDVESISVLKDAASSAIYGARAAYGVVLITTKKGKTGQKPQISFSVSGYWQSPAITVKSVNSLQYINMLDEAYINSGGSASSTELQRYYVQAYLDGTYKYTEFFDQSTNASKWQYCGNTDWFDELYKTSFSQQYNVNVSGGDEKTTYYASLGFVNENGILAASDDSYKKFNMNLNVTSQLTKWLQFSGKVTHTYSTEDHPITNSTAGISAYGGVLKADLSPLMPVKHSHTGMLVYSEGADAIDDYTLGIHTSGDYEYVEDGESHYAGQNNYTNPFAVAESGGYTKYKTNDLWVTGALKITPIKNLVINADFTFNFYNQGSTAVQNSYMDYQAVSGTETAYAWTKTEYALYGNQEDYYTAFNVFAEYSLSLKDDHNFKIMAGYNQEYKHKKYFSAERDDLIVSYIPDLDLATGEDYVSSSETQWRINGVFVRLNYDYKGKYLFEFNGRYDGSSRFAEGHRYAFFPSFSAGWRISEEKFFEPAKSWFSNLKIRASYGSLGNQVLDEDTYGYFPYLATYGTNSSYDYLIGGSLPVVVTAPGLVSSDFTWETVRQMDFGFDAGFFNNRLTASFDWYRRITSDMLVSGATLPATLGADVPDANSADMRTDGWEVALEWNDRLNNGFQYWAKLALSDYSSVITKYEGNDSKLLSNYYEGYKIGQIYGYVSDGLFATDEEAAAADQSALYSGTWYAGDVRYVDLNGDGKIDYGSNTADDSGDKTIIGNTTPRYRFGITLGFSYKNFDFEMFWQGVAKRDYWLSSADFWGLYYDEWESPKSHLLDYWTEDNPNGFYPRLSWSNSGNRTTNSRYLQNAAYGRLKNLTVGYTVPKKWINKFGISRARIYLSGENLLTITPLEDNFDPENLSNLTYPINRKISIGINVTL